MSARGVGCHGKCQGERKYVGEGISKNIARRDEMYFFYVLIQNNKYFVERSSL